MRGDRHHGRWEEGAATTAVLAVLLLACAIWGHVEDWGAGSVYGPAGLAALMTIMTARSIRDHRR